MFSVQDNHQSFSNRKKFFLKFFSFSNDINSDYKITTKKHTMILMLYLKENHQFSSTEKIQIDDLFLFLQYLYYSKINRNLLLKFKLSLRISSF